MPEQPEKLPEDPMYVITIVMMSGAVFEFEARNFEIVRSGGDIQNLKWATRPGDLTLQHVKIENIDIITSRKKP